MAVHAYIPSGPFAVLGGALVKKTLKPLSMRIAVCVVCAPKSQPSGRLPGGVRNNFESL